jgi:signal transduction histidine kinase
VPEADRRRPSLRRRVRWLFAAAALLVVIVGLFGVYALQSVLEARKSLAFEVQPAQLDAEQTLVAMVDQETGLRGFVLSGDVSFLEPYEQGLVAQQDALNDLADRAGDRPGVQDGLRRVEDAERRWRQRYAQPTIDAATEGRPSALSASQLDEGKVRFEEIRRAVEDLRGTLAAAAVEERENLDQATVLLAVALGVFAIVVLVGGWAIWRTYDRSIEAPLQVLTDAADRISVGELRQPVPAVGPLEIDQLAQTMELMRAALVNEIDALEQTRAALEARGADLESSNQDLEQFAYVASHDLQEPLRKVTSFCQLLQQRYGGQLDDRADEYIAYAVDGAKRMQILINDLLQFSRVGRTTGPLGPVDASVAMASALRGLSFAIDDHQASVTVGDLPEVWGEPALLESVFANLLGNALKFHREGEAPTVHVDAAPTDDGGWIITVQDEGIGIPAEHVERVFEIFRRLHTRDVYEGTGIGLALCRKIVESFGGKIWVDPASDGGTRIQMRLLSSHQPALEAPSP